MLRKTQTNLESKLIKFSIFFAPTFPNLFSHALYSLFIARINFICKENNENLLLEQNMNFLLKDCLQQFLTFIISRFEIQSSINELYSKHKCTQILQWSIIKSSGWKQSCSLVSLTLWLDVWKFIYFCGDKKFIWKFFNIFRRWMGV